MNRTIPHLPRTKGFTLMELLVVIGILAILASLVVAGMMKARVIVERGIANTNIRELTIATRAWATENNDKVFSPVYPGGMEVPPGMKPDDFFPEYYDLGDSGLWLDGVLFARIYMQASSSGVVEQYPVNDDGDHLKGTLFESKQSVKVNPSEEDWHKHSYAMNANLQYDKIYDSVQSSSDPYLTEKTYSNLIFAPNAMLFIENEESNIVMYEDRDAILETFETRWGGTRPVGVAAFLDGHAETLNDTTIPDQDPDSDRKSSRFWRGVDP